MQTHDRKKQMFLDMQEHPEKYSEEQIESMMDELDQMPEIERAWQKFTRDHRHVAERSAHRWLKVAASIVGVIIVSGIALAAIQLVRQKQKPQANQIEQTANVTPPVNIVPTDTFTTDTVIVEKRVFDNVPLDTMLMEIADYYHVTVDFQRDDSRQLRLHFVWKSSESLDQVVERLNIFEAVNIIREPEKLIIK